MCRVFAFPPGTPRALAVSVMDDGVGNNDDGVGYCYVKDGKFILKKYPTDIGSAMKSHPDFLGHMPHDGWTIAHERMATHGGNTHGNTHPFVRERFAVVHNGIFTQHEAIRPLASMHVLEGETDSEVAAWAIDVMGPRRFSESYRAGGVFLSLEKTGDLHLSKLSGWLKVARKDGVYILGTALPFALDSLVVQDGYAKWKADGSVEIEPQTYQVPAVTQTIFPLYTPPVDNTTVRRARYTSEGRKPKGVSADYGIVQLQYDPTGLLLHDPTMKDDASDDQEPTDAELDKIEKEVLKEFDCNPGLWDKE